MLKLQNVNIGYQNKLIIEDVNLDLSKGQFCCIQGPNGSGKSSLLKTVLGLVSPLSGNIKWTEKKKQIGYVPQSNSINSHWPISVFELLSLTISATSPVRLRNTHYHSKVTDITSLIGINHLLNANLSDLSGGETQKVFLARALITKPDILFLDEPTASLDTDSSIQVLAILKDLQKNHNLTIFLITHDLSHFDEYADHIVTIEKKKLTSRLRSNNG